MKKLQIWSEVTKDEPLVHEYDVTIEDDVYTLHHSYGEHWSQHIKGTEAASLENTGDDVNIKLSTRKKSINLDYHELAMLRALLEVSSDEWNNEIRETKTIKSYKS